MNYYDVIFAQQKAKKDSKYFDEISDAINVLAGTETTYTPSEMAPAIIDAIPTSSASGNPIHITDAANFPAESVVTTLEPVQEGSGDPSPENVRPITGHTGVELKHSGADTSIYETHSITFPQAQSPVYGCEVDWTEGVLRVTEVSATYDGSADESWSNRTAAGGASLFEIQVSNINIPQSTSQIGKCNLFPWLVALVTDKTYRLMGVTLTVHYDGITLAEWKNMLAETPLQITYPLFTPLEIPLTPEAITLLKGENNVWTDSGTSEISYKVDLHGYIQKLIDEASTQASALSVSPLSLGRSAVLTSTDGEDGGEIKDVESTDEADEVEEGSAEDKKADEPAEETEEAEDLTVKKEIAEELAETEKVEDIKETEEHESEVEE